MELPDTIETDVGQLDTHKWVQYALALATGAEHMLSPDAADQAESWWHACPYRFHDLLDLCSTDDEIGGECTRLLQLFVAHLRSPCSECRGMHRYAERIEGMIAAAQKGERGIAPQSLAELWNLAHTELTTLALCDVRAVQDISRLFEGRRWRGTLDLRLWDTSRMRKMQSSFADCSGVSGLEYWSVGRVTNMSMMFCNNATFNGPIGRWDTRSVVTMMEMFEDARNFNQPLHFDTRSVECMSFMFAGALAFNQPVLFDTRNVQFLSGMFQNTASFNQPLDLDMTNLHSMSSMFTRAEAFNSEIRFRNTERVCDMSGMFYGATSFNRPLRLKADSVLFMQNMFAGATAFNAKLRLHNLSMLRDTSFMFAGATEFNQPLDWLVTSRVTNMSSMFECASSFDHPIPFDTSSVVDMSSMFSLATSFNKPLGDAFTTARVKDMSRMFAGASRFNQPLRLDTSSVVTMRSMFAGAASFDQPVRFTTANVTDMSYMFERATALRSPVVLQMDTIVNVRGMFAGASAFHHSLLQLTEINSDAVEDMGEGLLVATSTPSQKLTALRL